MGKRVIGEGRRDCRVTPSHYPSAKALADSMDSCRRTQWSLEALTFGPQSVPPRLWLGRRCSVRSYGIYGIRFYGLTLAVVATAACAADVSALKDMVGAVASEGTKLLDQMPGRSSLIRSLARGGWYVS